MPLSISHDLQPLKMVEFVAFVDRSKSEADSVSYMTNDVIIFITDTETLVLIC